jgi:hypothetical protein
VSLLANIDFLAGDIITIFDTATLYELQFPNLDPRTSDTPDVAMARQDLSIVMRRMDRFMHNLREPITTTPDTLIRAIDMYNQRNLQAHPADLLRLIAPEALDRLKEVDALARKSNALSTDEMSALDFTNSWYVEQQFKEVDGKFIWNHEYEALKNAAKAKQKGLSVAVAVNAERCDSGDRGDSGDHGDHGDSAASAATASQGAVQGSEDPKSLITVDVCMGTWLYDGGARRD